jgi:tartrate-resistant acid phosphatase type 5
MPVRKQLPLILIVLVSLGMLLAACSGAPTPTQVPSTTPLPTGSALLPPPATGAPTSTDTPAPSATPAPAGVRIAVIGDFGEGGQAEADVAALVHGWAPDLVITVGDDNYPSGAAETIDAHIGRFYHDYIFPYQGTYGPGASQNRFFPTLGNHDWYTPGAKPYLDYFTLPGNGRYYDFVWGPVHFFALDSDENEPDGVGKSSAQAAWLKQAMTASTSRWNVVYFHHAPYSSGMHGSTTWMRWPFKDWGADVVLTGHDHTYERLLVDGLPYFVNGVGGGAIYNFVDILPESQFRYNANYGAMLVTVTTAQMDFEFDNRKGERIDSYQLSKP